jgi:hypothetical protein
MHALEQPEVRLNLLGVNNISVPQTTHGFGIRTTFAADAQALPQ